MAVEIVLPQWGMEMQDGTVIGWLKQEGDTIQAGEPLVEIETEKIETELESIASGIVAHILVPEGTTVPIRTVLAIVAAPGEDVPRPTAAGSATAVATSATTPAAANQVLVQVVPAAGAGVVDGRGDRDALVALGEVVGERGGEEVRAGRRARPVRSEGQARGQDRDMAEPARAPVLPRA